MSKQTNMFGAGTTPPEELPARPSTSTDALLEQEYEKEREKIRRALKPMLDYNESITGFCTDPEAVLRFTVAEEHHSRLFTRQYALASVWTDSISEILERWKKAGKVVPAPPGCRFNSPLLAVPKKDAEGKMTGVRLCIDLRQLNKYIQNKDRFQIPHIPDMLQSLANKKYFAQVDCSEAFGQWKLAEDAQQYTAFTWLGLQWMSAAAPFGVAPMPSLFQRFISRLFADMPWVVAYIDNIAWGSTSWAEHQSHCVAVLERLNSVNLRIKPGDAVSLGQSQITLLGHVITAEGIGIDPEKQKTMMNWQPPAGGAGLASFLGLGTFLRDHVRHYADITAPLEAIKKQEVIEWDKHPALLAQFNLVKRAFANAPFLVPPDFTRPFVVAADASQLGLGGVLYQPTDDEHTITKHNIVAICSHQLNETQRRYPIYKKELWAVVYCLRKFHTYIYGKRAVNVYTDHKPLIHILNQRTMSQALQQYIDVIMDYDLIINYRPGLLHIVPDALSRMFTSVYSDSSIAWGTVPNVRFIDQFRPLSSPCDYLCQQSIDAITPVKVLRRRHVSSDKVGEEARDEYDAEGDQENEENNTNHTYVKRGDKTQVCFVSEPTVATVQAHTEADKQEDLYQYSVPTETSITDKEAYSFDQALLTAPFYGAARYYAAARATKIMNSINHLVVDAELAQAYADADLQAAKEAEEERVKNNNGQNENNKEIENTADALTDIEKLLVAQEKRGRVNPPKEKQRELVVAAHVRGHFGEKAMLAYIDREGYWWPKLREEISAEIRECADCQRFAAVQFGFEPARSIEASLPGDHLQMDLASLPTSIDGYNFILVIVDVFTGFALLRPLKDKSAETVARSVWEVLCVLGLPKLLQSDNGSEFKNQFMCALLRTTGVTQRFIAAYNPRTDGKVERTVKTVKQTLVKLLQGATSLWPLYVPFVQLMYNTKVQELTGSTPFALMFGRKQNEPVDYTNTPASPITQESWKEHQDKIVSLILPSINKRIHEKKSKQRAALDKTRRQLVLTQLMPGSIVMIVDTTYIANPSIRPVTVPKFVGPYRVEAYSKAGTYTLRGGDGLIYQREVPLDQMKILFRAGSRPAPEPPKEGEEAFEVEEILDDRNEGEEQEYHVKWKGWPLKDATWEPISQFDDYKCIETYWKNKILKEHANTKKKKPVAVNLLFYIE